jgi:hypothetical protein
MNLKLFILIIIMKGFAIFAQDSTVYYRYIKFPEVTKIFYVQKKYGNNAIKEEGWVVRYKDAAKSNIFKVKDAPPEQEFEFKLGVWKGYFKNGMISYIDTAYIDSNSTGNIISYFNKKGVLTEKYYNYTVKEVDYKNTSVPIFQAPYNNTMSSKDVGNISICIVYYVSGGIKSMCKFCDTKPCGIDQYFDEKGMLVKEVKH